MYIIYTRNLGFEITIFVRERDSRGSTGGEPGALGEHWQQVSKGGAAGEHRFWLLNESLIRLLPRPATAAPVIYPIHHGKVYASDLVTL